MNRIQFQEDSFLPTIYTEKSLYGVANHLDQYNNL